MDPTPMVVGLNHHTAPMGVRERFWIEENRRRDCLLQLARAEGIDEVIVVCTCNRTEFWLWANDVTLAANSVMRLLAEYGLMLCEWKHFYRLIDEAALLHIFRVTSSLDSMVVGAPQIVPQVKEAWEQARKVGTSGRFLDAVLQKAVAISARVSKETALSSAAVSIPSAAVELVRQIFDTLENKKVLLIGAGEMIELAARGLLDQGSKSADLRITNRTFEHGAELATKLGGIAIPFEERLQHIAEVDIIISSTACPHTILSTEEVETISSRRSRPLVIVDLAMPRDVAPAVRNLRGVYLYDLDDLESVTDPTADQREAAAVEANKILLDETQGFRHKLTADGVVPTIVSLRSRLEKFCQQELDAVRQEQGPFSKDQDEVLTAVMSRMTQRIAGTLARELKEHTESAEEQQLTAALHRLLPSCNAPDGACRHQVGVGHAANHTA